MMKKLVRCEFHCHTNYSFDSLVSLEDLLRSARQRGIDKVAVTDHGCFKGALRAYEMDPERVILAEEVETTEGEILGYFMQEEIPQGLAPMAVIERLEKQNAFISIAHPFDPNRGNQWHWETLQTLLPHIDAVEVFNARCIKKKYNEKAYQFALENQKGLMVGSDAHSTFELGRATLSMPDFNSADEMRTSLKNAEFSGELSGAYVHIVSTYAKMVKKLIKTQNSPVYS